MSEPRKRLEPIIPQTAVYRQFVPKVGTVLTVDIPGEKIRVEVTEVVNPDIVRGTITSIVMGKSGGHSYKQGDAIPCKRARGMLGEFWEPISLRDIEMQEAADRAIDRELRQREQEERQQPDGLEDIR